MVLIVIHWRIRMTEHKYNTANFGRIYCDSSWLLPCSIRSERANNQRVAVRP
jgi:hypothetical protein